MKLGIWTAYYDELNLKDALRRLARLEWRDVELGSNHVLQLIKDNNWQKNLDPMIKIIEEEGINIWQIHSPLDQDVADFNLERREEAINLHSRSLDLAYLLKVPYVVIHPGGNIFGGGKTKGAFVRGYKSKKDRDKIFKLNVIAFKQFCEKAEKWDLRICAENGTAQGFCDWIFELWELIDLVDSKNLGICFDSSHANCLHMDIPEAIRECKDRLWATHMSDNDGTADQHRMPFSGKIDWVSLIKALKEIGYRNLFDLEIGGERCFPLEVRDAKLSYIKGVLEPMLK